MLHHLITFLWSVLQKAHKDLLAVATAKLDALKKGTEHVDDGLVHYLQNWLKNHIKNTDIHDYGH